MRFYLRLFLILAMLMLVSFMAAERPRNASAKSVAERGDSLCVGTVPTASGSSWLATSDLFSPVTRITARLPWESLFRSPANHVLAAASMRVSRPAPLIVGLPEDNAAPPARLPSAPAQTVPVSVNNNFFSPATVRITAGDTVQWTWVGSTHTVTSGDCCDADGVFCSPFNNNCDTAPASNAGSVYSHTFSTAGQFRYFCTVHGGAMTGTVMVDTAPAVSTIQFDATNYNVGEADTSALITVNRSGDTSGTSTVDFASSNGTANQLRDYEVANGTLTFSPGQTSKTFKVFIVDDVFVEGSETVNLTLSNPTGASLVAPSTATVTIVDNDSAGATSPVAKQFVANLTGADEVPATGNTVKGNGGIVQLSTDEMSAKVSLLFSGLTGSETGAHIHGPAAPGVNAPILFPLPLGNPLQNEIINPTGSQVADLKAGLHYMNVHSSGFTNGEIRGQLQWNPAEEADFFVRQAYFDFLGRTPDAPGFAFWTGEITNCQSNVQCLRDKRVDVSNAFFYELEFQQTAAYVLRLYRGAYGNTQPFPVPSMSNPTEGNKIPSYTVFVADRARVTGGGNLAQKQLDLANLFVTRPEFTARYAASLATADQFVDAVLLTLQNDLGVNLSGQRTNLINLYNTQGGRGAVMYRLADDNAATNPIANQPFIDAEYNRTFVAGQYFGYLRRNPDIAGFLFWLGQVNGAPLRDVPRQHAMVCSFITSSEFQLRFGPILSRNNNECPQ